MDGAGKTYLDRVTMSAGREAGTAEPNSGGREQLHSQEETGGRCPFSLGLSALVGSAEKIIPTRKNMIAVRQIIGILAEHRAI